jgi:Fe-S cluster biogenesis protein NfuA/nitrite reductase/ring-hydroxylating ferredoxin subunit
VAAPDVGERLEALLADIGEQGGPQVASTAERLVRLLVDYYGDGLARIVELAGADVVRRLCADPQVASVLVLHGLHPLGIDERIETALDGVRPYLGSHAGGIAYLGVDDHDVAHLRLDGSCHGCPSSTVTVRLTIEEAVLAAAPELAGIEVEGSVEEKPLLQIGVRPSDGGPAWRHPSARDLPPAGAASAVRLDGRAVLLARLGDTYYAYADACAACGGSFGTTALHGEVLTCPACAARFDVRLAGLSVDGSGRRLDPLPLLDDVSGIRVAVPAQLEDA